MGDFKSYSCRADDGKKVAVGTVLLSPASARAEKCGIETAKQIADRVVKSKTANLSI